MQRRARRLWVAGRGGLATRLGFICVSGLALMPATASAAVITFTYEGSGSGTLDGVPFASSGFVIVGLGDTGDRDAFRTGFFIDHTSTSINIDNLGLLNFTTGTRTFVNNGGVVGGVGFSRAGGPDLFSRLHDEVFDTWDMLSSIGPITKVGNLLQWTDPHPPVNTDAGLLVFDSTEGAFPRATFTATVVAEPSTDSAHDDRPTRSRVLSTAAGLIQGRLAIDAQSTPPLLLKLGD